jgi:hypothetical protein
MTAIRMMFSWRTENGVLPEMLHPEDPLELRPQVQGSPDFALRGGPIAKLCLSHGPKDSRETKKLSQSELRQFKLIPALGLKIVHEFEEQRFGGCRVAQIGRARSLL